MVHPASSPTVVHVALPGDRLVWTPVGLDVCRGDRVTLLGSGRISWSDAHGGGAKFHLWGRVAGGVVFGCTQDTTTAVMDSTGPLQLRLHIDAGHGGDYAGERGSLEVTVVRWPRDVDPVDGLESLAADPVLTHRVLAASERARLLDPVVPPPGWRYLPDPGPGDIYRHAAVEGRPAIDVRCDDDAGVLARDVAMLLEPATTIEWSWRVESLPGIEPENTAWTHDLLSVAVRFDTGLDLSWFWSTVLQPDDDAFRCPIHGRGERETHVPVRRGPAGLGRWRRESRNVWSDHHRFIGPPPERIEAVWLIAVSHFGHHSCRATFRDIALRTGDDRVQVL
ncbi:DUF3047 domain-containing protein [Pseudonocardia sp. GCM10023141]|uniref:DUF3047 domain-containing protein n=1 Tax=Pseudonocardia sp. GCM10023141 TaxID=3252653 RepID=UPI003622C003